MQINSASVLFSKVRVLVNYIPIQEFCCCQTLPNQVRCGDEPGQMLQYGYVRSVQIFYPMSKYTNTTFLNQLLQQVGENNYARLLGICNACACYALFSKSIMYRA
jgi:hypothetical protein